MIKKYTLILLFCIPFILSACTKSEENIGTIDKGEMMGYEYTVSKEDDSFFWKVGYKGDITMVEENSENQEELESFRIAINDSDKILLKLILSLSYFFIVTIIPYFFFKRKTTKNGVVFIVLTSIIALSIAFTSFIDLKTELADIKFHYVRITD